MLIRGRRAPIVGAVCMDMTDDRRHRRTVAPGDEVVLSARRCGERIDVREMAATIGTIP